jgi:hypothetical protein
MSEGVNHEGDDPTLRPLLHLLNAMESDSGDVETAAQTEGIGSEHLSQAALIKAQCLQEVEQGIDDVRRQLSAGEIPDRASAKLSTILADLALEAAAAQDHETYTGYLDMLLGLPEQSAVALADVCFAGVQIKNPKAAGVIHTALEAEKIRERAQDGTPLTPLLNVTLDHCADNDIPPDVLVAKYGIDDQHRWRLFTEYYARLAKQPDNEHRDEHQAQVDILAARLIEEGAFPATFVFGQVWYELARVQNPEMRARLVHAFMQSGDEVQLNNYTFQTLNWMGTAVLDDPELANQETVGYFDRTIELSGQRLQQAGMHMFDVASQQIHWRIKLALYNGVEPEDVIDLINLQTSNLLTTDIPDRQSDLGQNLLRNREYVERTRENLLSTCAQQAAKQGDFATARLFLSHILGETSQMDTLATCLETAETLEDIRALKPDELTMTITPDLDLHLRYAEAKLAANAPELAAVAQEYARTITQHDAAINYRRLYMTYKTLEACDGPRAIQVAKQLLSTLRAANAPGYELAYLSKALLKHGDPDEPRLAKEYVARSSRNRYEQLYDMWQLSKVL